MTSERARSGAEFIALVALTTSLVAMSIDTMLPALGDIAIDLRLADPNDRQLVLTAFFGGMTVGQLVCGPVSDSIGRKPAPVPETPQPASSSGAAAWGFTARSSSRG